MAKVLVTGASGFIGPHLVQALKARGDQVTCLVRSASRLERLRPLGVELVQGDVTQPVSIAAAVRGAETVFHVAGLVKALKNAELLRVNEGGVRNVAQACAEQANPPVLVVVSSLAAAGPSPNGRPRTEADPPQPVSNYGRSKRAGERAAESFAGRVPITIVRPPMIFGEGDAETFHMIKPIAQMGLHLVPGYKVRHFSILHAGDLCAGLLLAADRGSRLPATVHVGQPLLVGSSTASGTAQVEGTDAPEKPRSPEVDLGQGYYFLASERDPSYAEIGRLIATALGRKRFYAIPSAKAVIWTVAGVTQLVSQVRRRPGILSLDKAREATAGSWTCSAERARKELEFAPAKTLPERFEQTIRWYRREGWLK